MGPNNRKWVVFYLVGILGFGDVFGQTDPFANLRDRVQQLTPSSSWKLTASVPLNFPAHHPQGMVKVGDYVYMSSVEVINHQEGKGVGHLFKFNLSGTLLAQIQLGEAAMYHPGGIDYDGTNIWIPVAEYRPTSRSIIYKVAPETLQSTEVFRFNDHIGGIVHDTDSQQLHGVSWGSRTYHEWSLTEAGKIADHKAMINPSYYIDYQDCHYVGNHQMLCGGLKNYAQGGTTLKLGGIELVDLKSHQPLFQLPLALYAPSGRPMTQNPFWVETTPSGLRAYFVPDDDQATMFVYEVELK